MFEALFISRCSESLEKAEKLCLLSYAVFLLHLLSRDFGEFSIPCNWHFDLQLVFLLGYQTLHQCSVQDLVRKFQNEDHSGTRRVLVHPSKKGRTLICFFSEELLLTGIWTVIAKWSDILTFSTFASTFQSLMYYVVNEGARFTCHSSGTFYFLGKTKSL